MCATAVRCSNLLSSSLQPASVAPSKIGNSAAAIAAGIRNIVSSCCSTSASSGLGIESLQLVAG